MKAAPILDQVVQNLAIPTCKRSKRMKVGDILALAAPCTQVTICEADGRQHYAGAVHDVRSFDGWDLVQISTSNGRLILIVCDCE